MPSLRPPAVAGMFYPESPGELRADVEGYLREAPVGDDLPVPKALIAPHAGYVYSGPVAGSAFRTLSGVPGIAATIERVVLLGPSHFVPIQGLALPGHEFFVTPL